MSGQPTPEPALEPRHKTGHGFYHNATARLICLVDYDWSNPKENICNYHPDYLVTADSWPLFLYKNEHYDPENPIKGLFKNMFLMKAFKHIFIVPNDTSDDPRVSTAEPPLKHQKGLSDRCSHSHVASLIGMKLVAPHVIAYTAVQLRFALSSCTSWCIDFNYEAFYNNILTFFEDCCMECNKAEIVELLLWWNWYVSAYMYIQNIKCLVALSLVMRTYLHTIHRQLGRSQLPQL
ncbi:hypothetical protein PISMIDRAFT_640672 [Pisolithus microcarpus 441]|uniref:Uncharacterized protein n=1 Tax=Pisolithus microcarpus 441 TaxID=765257 RepID=A0A0C9YZR7_9AGAM|nr:hypothetical protein BKA83DRAFT_640672 [Pisolithus microcarpus]KIK15567.1 hypothetical protein PISMIDRAFT_640672 [Pisolithus microcarpus 441]